GPGGNRRVAARHLFADGLRDARPARPARPRPAAARGRRSDAVRLADRAPPPRGLPGVRTGRGRGPRRRSLPRRPLSATQRVPDGIRRGRGLRALRRLREPRAYAAFSLKLALLVAE